MPIHRTALVLLGSVLCSSAALAQTIQVVPADFATIDAGSSTAFPLGLSTPARVQYVYGAAETGFAVPVVIQTIAVRANGTSTNLAKAGIDLQITMSTTPVTVGTASTTFASNHGPNQTIVYTRKMTSINATAPSTPPQTTGVLPLDVPFVYDPAAGNLIVDFDIASQPTGAWSIDTPFTTTGVNTTHGTGCGGLSATSSGGAIGSPWTLSLAGAQAGSLGFALLGFSLQPAPIPIPGNPGCQIFNDVVAQVGVTIPGTTASVVIPVPPLSSLRGLQVFGQFATITPASAIQSSNTRGVTLASWVVLRVHNTSNNTSPTGSIQNYVGIVLELGV